MSIANQIMFKPGSRNIWLKPTATDKEKTEAAYSFREELYTFLNSTICHCYRHLAQIDRSNIER